MAKDLKEQIEIMTHYLNGGEVEFKKKDEDDTKWRIPFPTWNWDDFEYRIKPKQKQKVTIEKWLCRDRKNDYIVVETSSIEKYVLYKKVKLIETYEVEL